MNKTFKQVFTLRSLARVLSGCLVYYAGVAAYDATSRGTYNNKASVYLTLAVPTAFAFVTAMWCVFDAGGRCRPSLGIALLIGPILLLPVYFVLVNRGALSAWERIGAMIGGYLILPVLITTIQQIPMGWALDLSFLAVLLVCVAFRRVQDTDV